jgi:hypothetical protein
MSAATCGEARVGSVLVLAQVDCAPVNGLDVAAWLMVALVLGLWRW